MAASAQLSRPLEPSASPGEEVRAPFGALERPSSDPDRMSPRELRRLPGIGPTRALAIARARWELGLSGGPESWVRLHGIGPETVAAIQRHLDRAGVGR